MKVTSYSKPASNLESLIDIILRTDTGRSVVEKITRRFGEGRIAVEQYPAHIAREVRAVLPEGHPIGACYFENEKKIYVDFTGPAGLIAVYLTHEFALILEGSEAAALEVQVRFTNELVKLDPDFAKFMTSWTKRAEILTDYLDDSDGEGQAA